MSEEVVSSPRFCLGCGEPISRKQLEKRASAKFCSFECSGRYGKLKNYKRHYNESFMKDKALLGYFLGFWVADGHISGSPKSYGSVVLSSSDKQLIDDFILYTGYTGNILGRIKEEKTDENGTVWRCNYPQYTLHYTGPMSQYVQSLGYAPGPKTGKEFLPKEVDASMFPHFLRGFIDGDGSVRAANDRVKDGYPVYLHVSMVSASVTLLKSIIERMHLLGLIRGSIKAKRVKERLYRIGFGHADSIRICHFIYKYAPIKLERKYRNYLACKDLKLEKELQSGPCFVPDCHNLATSKGLCKLHADQVYHKAHAHDPDVVERGREAVRRYRADNHEEYLANRRENYAADPEKGRQATQAWREAHPDKVKDAKRAYRENNQEKIREYKRRYRLEHPEISRAMDHRKYEKNKEAISAKGKENYQKNKEKIKARSAASRARKRLEREQATPELSLDINVQDATVPKQ